MFYLKNRLSSFVSLTFLCLGTGCQIPGSQADTSPLSPPDCRGKFQVKVYENNHEDDLTYPSTRVNTSAPLAGAHIQLGTQSFQTNDFGFAEYPGQIPNDISENNQTFSVSQKGFVPLKTYLNSPLPCQIQVALSPLSREEQAGTPIPLETYSPDETNTALDLTLTRTEHALKSFKPPFITDSKTQFSYAIIRSQLDLDKVAQALIASPDDEALFKACQQKLSAGNLLVAFSNNSLGLGDTHLPITHVFENQSHFILATHLSEMRTVIPEVIPPFADRIARLIQFVSLPNAEKDLLFHVKKVGTAGDKVRLEIKL